MPNISFKETANITITVTMKTVVNYQSLETNGINAATPISSLFVSTLFLLDTNDLPEFILR